MSLYTTTYYGLYPSYTSISYAAPVVPVVSTVVSRPVYTTRYIPTETVYIEPEYTVRRVRRPRRRIYRVEEDVIVL